MNMMTTVDRQELIARAAIDPSVLPDQYASNVCGTCMEPLVHDGELLTFSKTEAPDNGDLVGLWILPSDGKGDPQRAVKRLVLGTWEGITYPHKPHPKSEVEFFIIVEMLNPPTRYRIPCSRIIGLHKVTGRAVATTDGMARIVPPDCLQVLA